jgi:hypothetical protein
VSAARRTFLREIEEAALFCASRSDGDRGEGVLQRVARLLEQREFLGGVPLFGLEPSVERALRLLCVGQRGAVASERGVGAESAHALRGAALGRNRPGDAAAAAAASNASRISERDTLNEV